MKDFFDNKLLLTVVFLCFLTFFVSMFSNKIVNIVVQNHYDQIADVIIKKLQKEYSPSPYGPGIDQDKIDVDAMLIPKTTEWEAAWGEYRKK